jgi:iron complex transport system substrate-binding protein
MSVPASQDPRKVKMRRCFYLSLLLFCIFLPAEVPNGRFISLSPSVTEIIFALGAQDQLAGVSTPADYPPEASKKEIVASYDGILYEKVAALKPSDCLTITGMQSRDSLQVLKRLGIKVTEYHVSNLNELYACILDIGKKSAKEQQAAAIVKRIRERIENISFEFPPEKQKAVFLVGLDPMVAVGEGSYLNDVCKAAGFKNVLENVPPSYSVISYDTIVEYNPDWIVLPKGEIKEETKEDFVLKIKMLNKNISIGEVSADLVMRPGPRVADGIAKLSDLRKKDKK